MEKGKQQTSLMLQANDIVYVPFSWMKNVAMSSSSIAASTAGAAVYVSSLMQSDEARPASNHHIAASWGTIEA